MSNINNNTSNTTIPGMLLPTQQGMIAGNPRDSAIAQGNAASQKLLSLQSIGGRGRRLRKRRGGAAAAATIQVPQFTMQYTPQGGPGQTPNSIIQQNALIGTQGAANAVYDKYATQMGGYYNNMNMNTNQYQWGCYSGGKKYKRSSKKISKKKRTKRRSVRRNKAGKSRKYKKM